MKILFILCYLLICAIASESIAPSGTETEENSLASSSETISTEPTTVPADQSQEIEEEFTDYHQHEECQPSNNESLASLEENEQPMHRDPSIVQNNFNVNESNIGLGHRLAESVFLVYTVGILTIASLILGLVILGILLGRLLKEERKIYVMPPPPPPTHHWKHQTEFDHRGYAMPPTSPTNTFEEQILH